MNGLGMRKMRFLALASAMLLALLAGCGTEENTTDLKTFDGLYDSYLSGCAECHTPGKDAHDNFVPGLDMSSADLAFQALKGRINLQRTEACNSLNYVGSAPESSFLVAILDSSVQSGFAQATNTDCEPRNHTISDGGQANNPSAEVLEGLKSWISGGAAR